MISNVNVRARHIVSTLLLVGVLLAAAAIGPGPGPSEPLARAAVASPDLEAVARKFHETFPRSADARAETTPIPGVFEIVAGQSVVYYVPDQDLLFLGEIWTRDGRSLTAERLAQVQRAALDALPTDQALRLGSGALRVMEIVDPDCPFCARLDEYLRARPGNVERLLFFAPLDGIHPGASRRAVHVLCAEDPSAALAAVYRQEVPDAALADCPEGRERLAAHAAVAKSLGVDATPVVIAAGERLVGFRPEVLDRLLASPNPLQGENP